MTVSRDPRERRAHISGYDMVLDDRIGLTLYRDGRQPAVQSGQFSQAEAMRAPGATEHGQVYDHFVAGLGGTERLIPGSYPLAIDGCTRFDRVWTPGGEITRLAPLPNAPGGVDGIPAGRIRSGCIIEWSQRDALLIGAGMVLYRLDEPYLHTSTVSNLVVEHVVKPNEDITSIIIYHRHVVVGTVDVNTGFPGQIHIRDAVSNTWICVHPTTGIHGSFEAPYTGMTVASGQYLVQTYMVIDNAGDHRLITNDWMNTIRFVATSNAWAILDQTTWAGDDGDYEVGDSTHPITSIVGAPLVCYFVKTDGLYHMESDGRAARIADWTSSLHADNGRATFFKYGGVFASHGRHGLVRVDVANLNTQWAEQGCAPGAGFPRITPINGRISAITDDGEWVAVSVFNGTDSFICYGRPNELTERQLLLSTQSPQTMNWHGSEGTTWHQEITAMQQASLGNDTGNRPLLWFATWDTTDPGNQVPTLQHMSLPRLATPLEDFINEGPHRFATDSWLYLPREDFGGVRTGNQTDQGWGPIKKIFTRLDLNAEYLTRYVTWIDAYMSTSETHRIFWDRAIGGSPYWVQIGRLDGPDRLSMIPSTPVQSGTKAGIMFHGHAEPDKPFAFYSAKLRAIPILEQGERRRYRVLVGRGRKANKAQDRRNRNSIVNQMWALQWADPVPLLDHTGVRLIVNVEDGMRYEEIMDPATEEVQTSVTFNVRVLRRPFIWGSGFQWGSGVTWS